MIQDAKAGEVLQIVNARGEVIFETTLEEVRRKGISLGYDSEKWGGLTMKRAKKKREKQNPRFTRKQDEGV